MKKILHLHHIYDTIYLRTSEYKYCGVLSQAIESVSSRNWFLCVTFFIIGKIGKGGRYVCLML